ncbi:putative acyl-CoA dehydrogenase, N-terminal domain [Lyophyllum shimeji]|uniref:Acyl-CoA dehydrogenase, N-terminal domain n=1 Tax=Lyophyllum shimeji TaxID=47721 RepID=A0A9P3UPC5_LYOSH|nr:putative acyl-CoA dehydrogenase, N-terminal domain [Lyophyllum shimeji]
MAMKEFTREEIAKHNKNGDLWIIVDSKVFDLSKFVSMHPGGLSVLLDGEIAGQDATEAFFSLHRYEVLQRPQYARLQVGTVLGQKQSIFPREPGALSRVPYAEPTWLTEGYHTPYYKDHHRAFQKRLRTFVDEVLFPDAQALQEKGKMPGKKVFEEFARLNIHAMWLGPGEHLKGRTLMDGTVTPEEFDYFHELIMSQEMSRIHARGYHDGAAGGTLIGLPAIKNFAKPAVRDKVFAEVFDGKKLVCLAISEAFAGSDVAGIRTFATKSADGRYWIVTGTKKWITNGHFADYLVTGCRTDKGMVVLLIERGEGVETKHINTTYGPASGTAFVMFDKVKVPVEHTLGPDDGSGLVVMLSNFNHERWAMCCSSLGAQRLIVEECMKWTTQRKVFGKPLNSQAVVRSRLASMIARVESAQAWLESITFQMNHMGYKQQSSLLAGQIAFLKKYCTETAQDTARDAVQVFGGRGITKTGMGRFIEHYHTNIGFDAILGGTEDVLGDLGEFKTYTRDEVAKHNTEHDHWIIIDGKIYDITKFKNFHPGGASVFLDTESMPGQDATEVFYGLHRHQILMKQQYARLQVGVVKGEKSVIHSREGELSKVPYAEPTWLSDGYYSPYFTENHRKFQKAMRMFVDEVVAPDALAREADGKPPSKSVVEAMGRLNIHAMRMGPGKHLRGLKLMDGLVMPEEFDYFHELIITQEFARCGQRGYGDGLMAGSVIGLPPVLNFGSEEIQAKVVPDVLSGRKPICLAISEAFAGSDVAGLRTSAVKTEDDKHWIINGRFAHYFTVGCKTENGFTVILVERGEGVETKPIKTSYSSSAGTAFVTFDNVKVPVENTLGPEGGGIFVMLSNFNHERWVMCCSSARSQRLIVEECLLWSTQRKAFGKPLHAQAVIRSKLAAMIARVESTQNWLENLTYQMNNMSYKQQASKLAGPIGLLKMHATRTAQETATDAVQIFGGRGITKTGMGQFIEHYHRTVPFDSVLGGAEDVLGDLGVRQAIRSMPKNARL